jgi:hypothetical protein
MCTLSDILLARNDLVLCILLAISQGSSFLATSFVVSLCSLYAPQNRTQKVAQ